jgi:hypothetical protein
MEKTVFKQFDFIVEIDDKWYSSTEFRTLVDYENILSGRDLDDTLMLDELVYDRWNMVMPMCKQARLLMDDGDGIKECGRFKRKIHFASPKNVDYIADPRNSKGKY